MGCDIHATIEYDPFALKAKKVNYKPYWGSFARDIDIDRGYYFFTILAGVRDTGLRPIIAEPRGAPNDATYEFCRELADWDGDAHSTSYVTFAELNSWSPTNLDTLSIGFDPEEDMRDQDFYHVLEMLAGKYGDENVRLCFFFDN